MRIIWILLIFSAPTLSYALDVSPSSPTQEAKSTRRWSLSQWMEQKGKSQWMDLWLKTPYDDPSGRSGRRKGPFFYDTYLGADYNLHSRGTNSTNGSDPGDGDFRSVGYQAGVFFSVFGLHGRYESSPEENRKAWDALFMLRLFGVSDQTSNLTLFYGLHNQDFLNEKTKFQQAGGYLTFYLVNAWAVQARYQYFLEGTSDLDSKIKGYRFEGTSWVEWGGVRFFGTWFHEPLDYALPGAQFMHISRDGVSAGIRVYLDFKK